MKSHCWNKSNLKRSDMQEAGSIEKKLGRTTTMSCAADAPVEMGDADATAVLVVVVVAKQ
jgi:hypothetical protein